MGDEFSQVYGSFSHREIDGQNIGDLTPLVRFLERTYVRPGEQLVFSRNSWRPSLVARSDAELYDVEQPRWAKRVYVTVEDGLARRYIGFLNMRALEMFKTRLHPSKRALMRENPTESDLICSAYLSPPRQLVDDGFVFPVVRDMGLYLNELGGMKGTIFASPIRGWGGLCSQACVYMASYPMIIHGSRVLGISDITFAASGKAEETAAHKIPIAGLNTTSIRSLFPDFLNLNAFMERIVVRRDTTGHDEYLLNRQVSLLADYLALGFPVIVLVKGARLVEANAQFYPNAVHHLFNNWNPARKARPEGNLHAILLIGYRAPRERGELYRFAYHDSLSGPYLPIDADALVQASYDSLQAENEPLALEFVVPLPKYVTIPLAQEMTEVGAGESPSQERRRRRRPKNTGLFSSSQYWKAQIELEDRNASTTPSEESQEEMTTFSLSRSGLFRLRCPGRESHFTLVARKDFFDRYLSLNVDDRLAGYTRWESLLTKTSLPEALWVEEFGPVVPPIHTRVAERAIRGLWGWPATGQASEDRPKPIVQVADQVLRIDDGRIRDGMALKRHANAIDVRKRDLLDVGAITSFHAGSLVDALKCLAYHRIQKVDLYAFPLDDLPRYFPDASSDSSLLDVVAGIQDLGAVTNRIATDVYTVTRDTGHAFLLNGFATYFPEISSPDAQERGRAVRAVQNIIQLAGRLRRDYGHDMRFIEIVAGTKLSYPQLAAGHAAAVPVNTPSSSSAMTQMGTPPSPPAVVQKVNYEEKFRFLRESLLALAVTANSNDVYISIEVEPGILPFLSNSDYLRSLISFLEDNHENGTYGRVGINVDVSHMWLCGIPPQWLSLDLNRKYISHVHINDTGPAHLCDLVPGTVHAYHDYQPWFDLFHKATNDLPRPATLPDFSCCLSVELEACRETRMIGSAYYRTKNMLSRFLSEKIQSP